MCENTFEFSGCLNQKQIVAPTFCSRKLENHEATISNVRAMSHTSSNDLNTCSNSFLMSNTKIRERSMPSNFSVLRMLKSNKYFMSYLTHTRSKLRQHDVDVIELSD